MTRRAGYFLRETAHRSAEGADRLILMAVVDRLRQSGFETQAIGPSDLRTGAGIEDLRVVLSMARSMENLSRLTALPASCRVVNSPHATLDTLRGRLQPLLDKANVPVPRTRRINLAGADLRELAFPFWLKRIDYHHILDGDVVRVGDEESFRRARDHFARQGHETAFLQTHVEGQHVKVYGVYEQATERMLFFASRESVTPPLLQAMQAIASRALAYVRLEVFGADFIVGPDGLSLVDLNAWPTFRPCREAAAAAIAGLLIDG